MKKTTIQFSYDKRVNCVKAIGSPVLEVCDGYSIGEGIAIFTSPLGEQYIVNTFTGSIRQLSTGATICLNDHDIDWESIKQNCEHGWYNAQHKSLRYGRVGRWDDFNNGICALSWTLYPDGEYFADSEGYGMEDNDEEVVYGIIDTNLTLIEPFRYIKNVSAYLALKYLEMDKNTH